METITTLVKIMASDFVLLIMAYFAQEQADRFDSKIARFFQHLFTWVIVSESHNGNPDNRNNSGLTTNKQN